jgi:isopentenyl-diphosphate delta-isomerase
MEDREIRGKRKDEHLLLAQHLPDGPGSSGFENINLIHDSVPELDLEEIDLGYIFLGKKIKFPLLINAITGGTQQAAQVNQALSTLAARQGIAMAVGSQTIAIEDPGLKYTFALVREANPDGIVLANISAASGVKEAIAAVEMIKADGLQLHFNIPQELAMPEGDRSFKGILKQVLDSACPKAEILLPGMARLLLNSRLTSAAIPPWGKRKSVNNKMIIVHMAFLLCTINITS